MRPAAAGIPGSRRRMANTAVRLVGVSVLIVALVGCNGHRRAHRVLESGDYAERHPIQVARRPVEHDISVPVGSYGLTNNQANEVRGFARRFKIDAEGPLVIRAPSGSPNELASLRALEDIRRVLHKEQIPPGAVVIEPYIGDGAPDAPVRLSFLRFAAEGPICGDWSRDLSRNRKNLPYRNFGCATQANLAAMVANPRDLVRPRGMTPRSSERRDVVWDKYVKGETTVAEKTEEETGKVSDVEGGGE